jgi:hypothetical protein
VVAEVRLITIQQAPEVLVVVAQDIQDKVGLGQTEQQTQAAAVVAHITLGQMAVPASSLLDTHFNWRNTWHILQK